MKRLKLSERPCRVPANYGVTLVGAPVAHRHAAAHVEFESKTSRQFI